jgi:CheY-like chemotaxis protein
MLTEATWQSADLRELIRDQLLRGTVDERRLRAWGPVVRLAPQMTLHVAMMLHELGTNSIKYGALSSPAGSIAVTWSYNNGMLNLEWVERGGPPVTAPSPRGFGTTLIEQSAKSEGGSAQMVSEAQGVTWKIALPLPASATTTSSVAPEPKRAVEPRGAISAAKRALLAGKCLLVVEDEPLIGLDLVSTLDKAGAEVAPPVGTEKEALELIERRHFDAVLLDANLHGRGVDAIAALLTRRGIPFVFVTGYGQEGLPDAFRHVIALPKPFSEQQLLETILKLEPGAANVLRLKR